MATTKYIGTGEVISADFKAVKWIGKTKGGQDVIIELENAINMGNIEWTMAEKNDVVPNVEFQACYNNTDEASTSTIEPWSITVDSATTAGSSEIILGAGTFYIGTTAIGLTRGGGSFNVEREYREINADGDRGAVLFLHCKDGLHPEPSQVRPVRRGHVSGQRQLAEGIH